MAVSAIKARVTATANSLKPTRGGIGGQTAIKADGGAVLRAPSDHRATPVVAVYLCLRLLTASTRDRPPPPHTFWLTISWVAQLISPLLLSSSRAMQQVRPQKRPQTLLEDNLCLQRNSGAFSHDFARFMRPCSRLRAKVVCIDGEDVDQCCGLNRQHGVFVQRLLFLAPGRVAVACVVNEHLYHSTDLTLHFDGGNRHFRPAVHTSCHSHWGGPRAQGWLCWEGRLFLSCEDAKASSERQGDTLCGMQLSYHMSSDRVMGGYC